MVDGALLLPINVFGLSGTPAELPSVKQPGSWYAKVDEDGVASHGGVVADLNVICVDGGNLAFSSNGAVGAGVDEPAPSKIGAGLPVPSGKGGL
jgi:hypothetical protein